METQQVGELVDRPMEIVVYQRYTCICSVRGETQTADSSPEIVLGQDIGIRLQAFLGWINNNGHLPYEKQQELLWELGQIEIGVGTLVAMNKPKTLMSSRLGHRSFNQKSNLPFIH